MAAAPATFGVLEAAACHLAVHVLRAGGTVVLLWEGTFVTVSNVVAAVVVVAHCRILRVVCRVQRGRRRRAAALDEKYSEVSKLLSRGLRGSFVVVACSDDDGDKNGQAHSDAAWAAAAVEQQGAGAGASRATIRRLSIGPIEDDPDQEEC